MQNDNQLDTDLAKIESLDWPHYPLLPIKRYRTEGVGYDCALLRCVSEVSMRFVLHYCNMWDDVATKVAALTESFDSAQAVINAGWVVD